MRIATLSRTVMLAAAIALTATAARAGIHIEDGAAVPPPASVVEPMEPLVSPLATHGIDMKGKEGASPTIILGLPQGGATVPPVVYRDATSQRNAQNSLARAHAFSRNAYREVRKDETLPWWAFGPYGW